MTLEQTFDFPTFRINQVVNTEKVLELLGVISSDSWKSHKWVDDKWIGSLRVRDSVVFGRWQKQDSNWKFAVNREDITKADFVVGQLVELIDGYWGERVELVIDKSILWERTEFIESSKNTHDHCFFCWATISESENTEHMVANERETVCLNCFDIYVNEGSFDFIQYPPE